MRGRVGEAIDRHCAEIERCNQRGGRMLSVVDLLDAGTIDRNLAAYCLAAIGRGASFMVGAMPGGAGKTTVMGALLNFVPPDVLLAPADGMTAIQQGANTPMPRRCYICHEIGSGPYYAYLWGEELRAYFDLPAAGHVLATNLHADTYDQAHRQICRDNGVPESSFRRMNLMVFMSVRRNGGWVVRRIEEVWESNGTEPHHRVFAATMPSSPVEAGRLVSPDDAAAAGRFLDRLATRGVRTIEEVRAVVVNEAGR
jgi:hypothetical protein